MLRCKRKKVESNVKSSALEGVMYEPAVIRSSILEKDKCRYSIFQSRAMVSGVLWKCAVWFLWLEQIIVCKIFHCLQLLCRSLGITQFL